MARVSGTHRERRRAFGAIRCSQLSVQLVDCRPDAVAADLRERPENGDRNSLRSLSIRWFHGHSQGGLIARWHIAEPINSGRPLRIDRLLTFSATPHHGAGGRERVAMDSRHKPSDQGAGPQFGVHAGARASVGAVQSRAKGRDTVCRRRRRLDCGPGHARLVPLQSTRRS